MIPSAKKLCTHLQSMFFLLACFPLPAIAQTDDVIVGFSDHSLIAGFSDSEIIDRVLERDINYRIVLGALERVRGDVIPEDSQRLRGDVTKITYEVSQEFSGEDVFAFFQEQIASKDYETLYSCEGRECGSSNYWANDIFRNRILYGPERNQHFIAFRANSASENDPYFSLYIITRVNRRIYAYLEIVEPGGSQDPEQIAAIVEPEPEPSAAASSDGTVSSLLQQLREQGSAILPAYSFLSNDRLASSAAVEPLISALNSDTSVSVYIVAHLKQDGLPLEEALERSTARADSLRQALIAGGVEAQRLEAAGIGPLSPNCAAANCEERIELVLR